MHRVAGFRDLAAFARRPHSIAGIHFNEWLMSLCITLSKYLCHTIFCTKVFLVATNMKKVKRASKIKANLPSTLRQLHQKAPLFNPHDLISSEAHLVDLVGRVARRRNSPQGDRRGLIITGLVPAQFPNAIH